MNIIIILYFNLHRYCIIVYHIPVIEIMNAGTVNIKTNVDAIVRLELVKFLFFTEHYPILQKDLIHHPIQQQILQGPDMRLDDE